MSLSAPHLSMSFLRLMAREDGRLYHTRADCGLFVFLSGGGNALLSYFGGFVLKVGPTIFFVLAEWLSMLGDSLFRLE
ncbi:hypothetical protein DSUL_20201 [Desulfovibrionales bacterium]